MGVGASVNSNSASISSESEPRRRSARLPPANVFRSLEDESLTEEQAYEKIEWVMGQLKRFPDARSATIRPALDFLNEPTMSLKPNKVKKWVEKLRENGIIEWTWRVWPSFWNPDFISILDKPKHRSSRRKSEAKIVWQNFHMLFMIFWNGTDASPEFCKDVVDRGMVEELLILLKRPDCGPQNVFADEYQNYIVQATTGILHNCLRLYRHKTKRAFRAADGVSLLADYMTSDDPLVRTKAAMVLAFGINEEEIELINPKRDIISFLCFGLLEPALKDKNNRAEGFSLDEIIEALNELAINDQNKLKIAENGVLKHYLQVMERPKNVVQLRAVVEGFWVLSFKPEVARRIEKLPACVRILNKLKSNMSPRIAKAAAGAVWNISQKNRDKVDTTGNMKTIVLRQGHLMISYDHEHKEIVRDLNNRLKSTGFITWFDADKMTGSTLEAMANAIEKSSVVIICMSDRYKQSSSCRTEAEYAYRLQKDIIPIRTDFKYKADGWLGILVGAKLHFDCYSQEQVSECCEKLAKELGDRGRIRKTAPRNPLRLKSAAVRRPQQQIANPVVTEKTENWDKERVRRWLVDADLEHLSANFKHFDGRLLMELRTMYKVAPNVFYGKAEKDLGLKQLPDLLKFTCGMDKLK